jgi:hypothetical protein
MLVRAMGRTVSPFSFNYSTGSIILINIFEKLPFKGKKKEKNKLTMM